MSLSSMAKGVLLETEREVASQSAVASQTAKPVEFLDLKAQFAGIREEVMEAVARVMDSQHFILGAEVSNFESEVAETIGVKHAISCASGTDALILSMLAAEIGPGDEVITTPFSFIATAGAIARVGAKPVFVDIERDSFNIDPLAIEAAITSRTRAILPVHLFGLPAELDPIIKLASEKGLIVIEDGAQAIGAKFQGKAVGTVGTFGCFSFFPSKNLGGAGDGGLVTTHDDTMVAKLRLIRVHGSRKKYHHEILGTNSRLDAIQAAILRVKLHHLGKWTEGRRSRAEKYRTILSSGNVRGKIQLPVVNDTKFYHVYNQFTLRCPERNALKDHLKMSGIPSEIYYPLPLHLQPAFGYLGYITGQFPEAERASREALSLPVYPELTDSQQEFIAASISEFCEAEQESEVAHVD
jgi:dTDP-4-amino-4,6-dideoxygalactose transaminase